jgi:hypothetical protein
VLGERFKTLPSVVARNLDRDPEQLDLVCLTLLQYAEMKRDYDSATRSESPAAAHRSLKTSAPKLYDVVDGNTYPETSGE